MIGGGADKTFDGREEENWCFTLQHVAKVNYSNYIF